MKKKRKPKEDALHFGLNDLLITLGVLAGLAFGIWYFRRNPQEATVSSRLSGRTDSAHINATIYYMLLGGCLGGLAYEGYEKWKNRKRGG